MSAPAVGWYKDPDPSGSGQRFWDGAAWTQQVRPFPVPATTSVPSAVTEASSAEVQGEPAPAPPVKTGAVKTGRFAGRKKRPPRASYGRPDVVSVLVLMWVMVSALSILSAKGTVYVPFLP